MATDIDWAELLKEESVPGQVSKRLRDRFPTTPQEGPLRWVEKEHRCASRGCGSSTHCKVQGIPYCMVHALKQLNDMLIAAGFKGVV